jgi:hypothetical protein
MVATCFALLVSDVSDWQFLIAQPWGTRCPALFDNDDYSVPGIPFLHTPPSAGEMRPC